MHRQKATWSNQLLENTSSKIKLLHGLKANKTLFDQTTAVFM